MTGDPDGDEVLDADDPIDGDRARLEARFRELEQDEQLRRMRGGAGSSAAPDADSSAGVDVEEDDFARMKAALADDADSAAEPAERYVLLLCPACAAKNRTSLTRVRASLPRCGACKQPLWFTKR